MPVDYGYATAIAAVDKLPWDDLKIEYAVTDTADRYAVYTTGAVTNAVTFEPLTVNWGRTIGEIMDQDDGILGEFDRYRVYWNMDGIRLAEDDEFKDELKDQEISETDFEELIVGK